MQINQQSSIDHWNKRNVINFSVNEQVERPVAEEMTVLLKSELTESTYQKGLILLNSLEKCFLTILVCIPEQTTQT